MIKTLTKEQKDLLEKAMAELNSSKETYEICVLMSKTNSFKDEFDEFEETLNSFSNLTASIKKVEETLKFILSSIEDSIENAVKQKRFESLTNLCEERKEMVRYLKDFQIENLLDEEEEENSYV